MSKVFHDGHAVQQAAAADGGTHRREPQRLGEQGEDRKWQLKSEAAANAKKHRVTFEEASSVFLDPLALTFWDPDHSEEEDREITIGRSVRQRVLLRVTHGRRGSCANHQCAAGDPPGAKTV